MTTMSVITVVTAVQDGGHYYLRDTYESLRAQELPDGWTWQWCVQEDGDTGVPGATLPDDPRIVYRKGLPGRPAVARTMALAHAKGALIRTLDADDILLPGALSRDIEVLTSRAAWCVSACLDLLEDGSTRPGPHDPPSGPLQCGFLYNSQETGLLAVQANTFAAHTDLVWALGGWTAITGAEAVGLALAAEAVAPGWFIGEPSLLYRKHPARTTASDRYWNHDESAARIAVALQRAAVLKRLGWTWRSPIAS